MNYCVALFGLVLVVTSTYFTVVGIIAQGDPSSIIPGRHNGSAHGNGTHTNGTHINDTARTVGHSPLRPLLYPALV